MRGQRIQTGRCQRGKTTMSTNPCVPQCSRRTALARRRPGLWTRGPSTAAKNDHRGVFLFSTLPPLGSTKRRPKRKVPQEGRLPRLLQTWIHFMRAAWNIITDPQRHTWRGPLRGPTEPSAPTNTGPGLTPPRPNKLPNLGLQTGIIVVLRAPATYTDVPTTCYILALILMTSMRERDVTT
jgi:hypothetical protein